MLIGVSGLRTKCNTFGIWLRRDSGQQLDWFLRRETFVQGVLGHPSESRCLRDLPGVRQVYSDLLMLSGARNILP